VIYIHKRAGSKKRNKKNKFTPVLVHLGGGLTAQRSIVMAEQTHNCSRKHTKQKTERTKNSPQNITIGQGSRQQPHNIPTICITQLLLDMPTRQPVTV
jgi:hypothetical protein